MVVLKRRIREICSHEIVGIGPGDPVSMAIEIMRGRNISSIRVVEAKRPLGIFTERSVVRFAATRGLDFSGRRIAELNQEIVQPLTVSTGVIDMLGSGRAGPLTVSQRDMLQLASESVERVNQLVAYMRRIAGLPESYTPDAAIIRDSYR
jgi:CBS domain-containing protein